MCVSRLSPRRCVSVTFGAGSQWLILSSGGCLAHSERASRLHWRRAPVTGLPDQGSPRPEHVQQPRLQKHACKNSCSDALRCLSVPFAWPLSPPTLAALLTCATTAFPDRSDLCSYLDLPDMIVPKSGTRFALVPSYCSKAALWRGRREGEEGERRGVDAARSLAAN